MRALSTIALMTLVTALSAAPVPKELKAPADGERIQGMWIVTQGQPGAKGYRWTFEGEKLFAGGTADAKGLEYTYGLRSGPLLTEFDILRDGRISHLGVYKFVGDELHLAYHSNERPTDFTEGGGRHLHILRRFAEVKK